MKKCCKCGEAKPLEQFYRKKDAKDGRMPLCKPCSNAKTAAYAKTNKGRAYMQGAQSRHRETLGGRATVMLRVARTNAEKNGVACSLTKSDIVSMLEPQTCSATGLKIEMSATDAHYRHPRSPSLDRISHRGDYSRDNTRLVCWQFNLARNEYGDEWLLELADAIKGQYRAKLRKEKV